MIDKITRIKKTGEIVKPLGKADSNHTYCLFTHKSPTKKGKKGDVRAVRNDNLIIEGEN